MASISFGGITKIYPNGFKAVQDLDLSVKDGEFMVIVGPSGCGKTTALRMAAGLEEISTGELRIGDRIVNNVSSKDRDVAMVFQNYALYPHMSVAENIGFSLNLRKLPKAEINRKVTEAAAMLGLSEYLNQKPARLSGGQRQRVAMGRAIVRSPSVFLMDEPLSNLDAKLRVQMRTEVRRIQQQIGVATLYVTHDQTEALTLGDRVAVMRKGVLQQCDDPQTLYGKPSNLFVAAFIGSPAMNLFEASISSEGDSLHIGSQVIEMNEEVRRLNSGLSAYFGKKIVVGFRSEDMPIAEGDLLRGPVIHGRAEAIEAIGSDLLVHFSLDATRVSGESLVDSSSDEFIDLTSMAIAGEGVARVQPRAIVKVGDTVPFAISPERLLFFDQDTEQVIS